MPLRRAGSRLCLNGCQKSKPSISPISRAANCSYGAVGKRRKGCAQRNTPPPMVRRYAALAYAPGAPLPDPLPAPRLEIAFDEQTQVLARFSLEAQAPL